MGFITKASLLTPKLETEDVETQSGTVRIRELTVTEVDTARTRGKDQGPDAVALYMLAAAIVDENGARLVSDDEAMALKQLGMSTTKRLIDVMNRLNTGVVADVAKN